MRRPLAVAAVAAAAVVFGAGAASAAPTANHPHAKTIKMTGAQEVPGPGDPDGRGWFTWKVSRWHLCYVITAKRIKPATLAHIHKGPAGVAGPIVIALKAPTNGRASGCIKAVRHQTMDNAMTTLTWAELRGIARHPAQYYANVHNDKYPAGAIRGQLARSHSMTTDPYNPGGDPYNPGGGY